MREISQEIAYTNVFELINIANPNDAKSAVSERHSGMGFQFVDCG